MKMITKKTKQFDAFDFSIERERDLIQSCHTVESALLCECESAKDNTKKSDRSKFPTLQTSKLPNSRRFEDLEMVL